MRFALVFAGVPAVASAVPMELAHQGRLLGADGAPLDGAVTLDVALYDAPAGGTALFAEHFAAVPIERGYYSVRLGAAATPLDDADLDGGARYLGLSVNGGPEVAPRTPVVSVAYAVRSGTTDRPVALDAGAACTTGTAGALDYRTGPGELYLCDGAHWVLLATGTIPFDPEVWADPAYGWRRVITLSGAAGAGEGYAVKLRIGSNAAVSGAQLHLSGHASDFPSTRGDSADFAFYGTDGTVLPFWVESVAAGVATVWVKVAADLSSNRDIILYYGSPTSTPSDGDATFLLFDEFTGVSVNTAKWIVESTVSVSGGQAHVGDGVTDHDKLYSIQTFDVGHQMQWAGKINNEAWTSALDGFVGTATAGFMSSWHVTPILAYVGGQNNNATGTRGSSYTFLVQRKSDGLANLYQNGALQTSPNSPSPGPASAHWHAGTDTDDIDYVFVTKYADTEPGYLSALPEQAR